MLQATSDPNKWKNRREGEPWYTPSGRRLRTVHPISLKERLSGEQNHRCCICGGRFGEQQAWSKDHRPASWLATYEHIVEWSAGGLDEWENLAVSHSVCNNKRSNQHPSGRRPKGSAWP